MGEVTFELIPEVVYVMTALFTKANGESFRSLMVSDLGVGGDDALWYHVEYSREAAERTLRLLQDAAERLEQKHYQWPDGYLPVPREAFMDHAADRTAGGKVVGYVSNFETDSWPKGRGHFTYWENLGTYPPNVG